MAEAHRITLTMAELEKAINTLPTKERQKTAFFFMGAMRSSEHLFDQFPGKLTDTNAELWITDEESGNRSHVSLDATKRGWIRFENVDTEGKVLEELTDGRAVEAIKKSFTEIGLLYRVID